MGLAPKLALAFIGLISLVLVVSGGLSCWLGYREAEGAAIQIQQEKARDAAGRIGEFLNDIERQIEWTTPLQWDALPLDQRRYDFIRLLREVPAIAAIAEIDGRARNSSSCRAPRRIWWPAGTDFAADPRFVEAEAKGVWFSPVYFRNQSEPYMRIAVAHAGHHAGVTVANVNLSSSGIWSARCGSAAAATPMSSTGADG